MQQELKPPFEKKTAEVDDGIGHIKQVRGSYLASYLSSYLGHPHI
jgi:hypothetical protein